MADRRSSLVILINKLDHFRGEVNNLTAAEETAVEKYGFAVTELGKIVKQLDTIKTNDESLRIEVLDYKLVGFSFDFSERFEKGNMNPGFWLGASSYIEDISKEYSELLGALKKEEASSAPNIDDKAPEEGSTTKRRCETGEGSSVNNSPPGDSGLILGGDLVRFDSHKERLIQLLLEDNSGRKNVMVKGGSGMTALVRKVCEDVRMRKHFATITWISVPQINDSELIREEIFLQLLFENKVPFPDDFVDPNILGDQAPSETRSLIVVDNLVDPKTWETFRTVRKILCPCPVIFLTRHEMAQWCTQIYNYGGEFKIYKLKDISEEESWVRAPFGLKKFPKGEFPSPLKEVCQLIVKECEELPEANFFLLRDKKGRNSLRNDEWEPMISSCKHYPRLRLIQQTLKVLYEDDRLFCLFYLSIFPKDSLISCERVSRLWVAEGFLPDLGRAESVFNDLLDRKCILLVEERSDGKPSTFRVDDLVREIIVSLSDRRNLVTITSQSSTNCHKRVRCLYVRGTIEDLNKEKIFRLCSLFVLDVSSDKDKTTTSEASPSETYENPLFLSNLEHLKVLDLTGAPFLIPPDEWFNLTGLRYWSSRDPSIKEIPHSIVKLTHLEFLDLKHSLVTELPSGVERLEGIRHILIYHHEKDPLMESFHLIGFRALCSIKGFKCLEKLCFVESDNNILEDLRELTKLKRLGITKLKKEQGKLLCCSLEELQNLKSLNVHAFDQDEIIDLHHLSLPPEFLKHLYLHGHLEKLPNWISSLRHLTKIILRWSQLKEDLLATLGELLNLAELELRRAYEGRQLDFKDNQFPKLKILLLDELEGLRSISLEKGTMPCLENLTISRCEWLERIPSGIEHIYTIQKLTFFDMSREFYEKVQADREKGLCQNIKGIREVYFTQWRAGHWETHGVSNTDEARPLLGCFPNLFTRGNKNAV